MRINIERITLFENIHDQKLKLLTCCHIKNLIRAQMKAHFETSIVIRKIIPRKTKFVCHKKKLECQLGKLYT